MKKFFLTIFFFIFNLTVIFNYPVYGTVGLYEVLQIKEFRHIIIRFLPTHADALSLIRTCQFNVNMQQDIYQQFMDEKYCRSLHNRDNTYRRSNTFFPRQLSMSWRDITIIDYCVENSPLRKQAGEISFKYPTNGSGFIVSVTNFRRTGSTVDFIFRITPQIHHDINQCINHVIYQAPAQERVGKQISPFIDGLLDNTSILGLGFGFQHMEHGMEKFCDILVYNPLKNLLQNLQVLDLTMNQITDISACRLAQFLASSTTRAVRLSDNQITEIGAGSLAMMLGINKSIEEFDLQFNFIGENAINLLKQVWIASATIVVNRQEEDLVLGKQFPMPCLRAYSESELLDM